MEVNVGVAVSEIDRLIANLNVLTAPSYWTVHIITAIWLQSPHSVHLVHTG